MNKMEKLNTLMNFLDINSSNDKSELELTSLLLQCRSRLPSNGSDDEISLPSSLSSFSTSTTTLSLSDSPIMGEVSKKLMADSDELFHHQQEMLSNSSFDKSYNLFNVSEPPVVQINYNNNKKDGFPPTPSTIFTEKLVGSISENGYKKNLPFPPFFSEHSISTLDNYIGPLPFQIQKEFDSSIPLGFSLNPFVIVPCHVTENQEPINLGKFSPLNVPEVFSPNRPEVKSRPNVYINKISKMKKDSSTGLHPLIKYKGKLCKFCKSNYESEDVYLDHNLRQKIGNKLVLTCPVLRRLKCKRCGKTGDNAHTITYCPLSIAENGEKPVSIATQIKKTKRNASGKIRAKE